MLIAILVAPAIAEASCADLTAAEFRQHLLHGSPFKGNWWAGNGDVGPTIQDFRQEAGVFYVVSTPSNSDGTFKEPREYVLRFPAETKVEYGQTWFTLNADCTLAGAANSDGAKFEMRLEPTFEPKSAKRPDKMTFSSDQQFTEYLVDHSPFVGTWDWRDKSGRLSIDFSIESAGRTEARVIIHNDGEFRGKDQEILVSEPPRVKIRIDGDRNYFQLDLYANGALQGIQSLDNTYAVLVDVLGNQTR